MSTPDEPAPAGSGVPADPGPSGPPVPPETASRASTVLVLGIVSLVTFFAMCGLGFIPAVIALSMVPAARREIEASGGALGGAAQLRTGRVLAWVTVGLTALVVTALVVVLTGLLAGRARPPGAVPGPAPAVSQVTRR